MNSWRATVFGAVFLVFNLPIVFYLLTHPALLRRRVHGGPLAEKETSQKIIVALVVLCLLALFVLLDLDHHSGGAQVPGFVVLIGDLLVAGGLVLVLLVLRTNPFAAATVTVEPEQTVISNGPYALVRHPMYSGGLLLFLGIPLALGSWWGLVLFVPLLVLLIWRLKLEETYLSIHLPGYRNYCAKVTHRLVPCIW